ncbi:MAG: hypothetical protein ACOYMS_03740 [Terrimicrobiaceae bacterium]
MTANPPAPTREELARELLRYKMMEYSQDLFCATWLVDLEWDLWTAAERRDPSPIHEHTASLSRECRTLAEIADGWWVYKDETRPEEFGPVFVPMERWLQILAERTS